MHLIHVFLDKNTYKEHVQGFTTAKIIIVASLYNCNINFISQTLSVLQIQLKNLFVSPQNLLISDCSEQQADDFSVLVSRFDSKRFKAHTEGC